MRALFACLGLLLLGGFGLATAAEPAAHVHDADTKIYQCPMHPWIKSDHPGKCTICGMDLVATSQLAASDPASADGTIVSLSASSVTTIGVRTAVVARQALTRTLRVSGRIDDDDTRHRILSARVPGRVEKLFVNFVGAPIEADAPLATLWSPEVLTAERVFVERLKAGETFSLADRAASREQLQQLGLSETDIAQLEKNREPSAVVTVRAPGAGTVVAKSVYEGQYVQPSDRLFEIGDFSRMWFVFDAFAQDIPWLSVGQTVEITTRAVPGETIVAPIEFIDPNFDEMRQTARVRAILPNPHYSVGGVAHRLPHRVLAEGRVLIETPAVLAAPRSAVLDTGSGPVVYVAASTGRYEQRPLKLGRRGDGLVEILSGLSEGEAVVTEGNLLIDAQAQLSHEAAAHGAHELPPPPATTDAAKAVRDNSTIEPGPASNPLAELASAAIDAADALASDDYARYVQIYPRIVAAAREYHLPELKRGDSLSQARQSFEPWSTQVTELVRPHRGQLGVKVFQCPMSPVLAGKGRWLQRSLPLKNPFFGSAMPDCGAEQL